VAEGELDYGCEDGEDEDEDGDGDEEEEHDMHTS
jgi:hypothetical protein